MEGVGHALKKIHRALRPNGLLLDIHPEPEPCPVSIQTESDLLQIGFIEKPVRLPLIHASRSVRNSLIEAGYFKCERKIRFDFFRHFDSVDSCLTYLSEKWFDAVLDESIAERARALLPDTGELQVRQAIQAMRLRACSLQESRARFTGGEEKVKASR